MIHSHQATGFNKAITYTVENQFHDYYIKWMYIMCLLYKILYSTVFLSIVIKQLLELFKFTEAFTVNFKKFPLSRDCVSLLQEVRVKSVMRCGLLCKLTEQSCEGFEFIHTTAHKNPSNCYLYTCVNADGVTGLLPPAEALCVFVNSDEKSLTNMALSEFVSQ